MSISKAKNTRAKITNHFHMDLIFALLFMKFKLLSMVSGLKSENNSSGSKYRKTLSFRLKL